MTTTPVLTQDAVTTRTIFNPATGEPVGEAPVHTVTDLQHAVDAALAAQPAWATLGHEARSAALLKAGDAIEARAEELAHLLSREQSKPLNGPNARFEVGACAAWLRAAAGTPWRPKPWSMMARPAPNCTTALSVLWGPSALGTGR